MTDKGLACSIDIDGVFLERFFNKKPESASLALLNNVLLRSIFPMVYIDHLGSSFNSKIKYYTQLKQQAPAPSTTNYKIMAATKISSRHSEKVFLPMQAQALSASAPVLFERLTTPHRITSHLTTSHRVRPEHRTPDHITLHQN